MSSLPSSSSDDTGEKPNGDSPPDAPRWVKVAGIIAIVLILLFVILKLTGIGGDHGPGRHLSGSEPIRQTEQEVLEGVIPHMGDY